MWCFMLPVFTAVWPSSPGSTDPLESWQGVGKRLSISFSLDSLQGIMCFTQTSFQRVKKPCNIPNKAHLNKELSLVIQRHFVIPKYFRVKSCFTGWYISRRRKLGSIHETVMSLWLYTVSSRHQLCFPVIILSYQWTTKKFISAFRFSDSRCFW
jgi:hypothetical protein